MSKIIQGGIWISVIVSFANCTILWFFGARWFGLALLITAGIIVLLLMLRQQLARKKADMIVAGKHTPTAHRLDSIITTLADSGEDHDPERYRIHQLQEIRYQAAVGDIPRDTIPAKP